MFLVWYPLLVRKSMRTLLQWPARAGARRVLRVELRLRPADSPVGMHGCGMLVLNTPWQLEQRLAGVPEWLAATLGESDQGTGMVDWLIPDAAG